MMFITSPKGLTHILAYPKGHGEPCKINLIFDKIEPERLGDTFGLLCSKSLFKIQFILMY